MPDVFLFYYCVLRSAIIQLAQMCRESMEGFDMFSYEQTRHKRDGCMTDILDGEVPKAELQSMHDLFTEFKSNYTGDCELIEFSLILSLFYDGDKLYDRSNDSLWPLMMSVLNCDPSYRIKLGLGIFEIALHNITVGSGAEQSMIDDLLSQELKQLENGILFEFELKNGEKRAIFLQARVVYFHLDTRAFEKVFHVSGAGSLCGCSTCGTCFGLSRPILGTPIYVGHTLYLPRNHVFRTLGERHMPVGYFGEDLELNPEHGKLISADARAFVVSEPADRRVKKSTEKEALPSEVEVLNDADAEHTDETKHPRVKLKRGRFLPPGKVWISKSTKFEHYAEALWFPVDDTRPQVDFKRVQHEAYVNNSLLAKTKELNDFIDKKGKLSKSATYVVNSVHSKLSAWIFLHSPRFQYSCYDLMHVTANAVAYFMQIIKGDRGLDTKSRKLSVSQGRFPFLINMKLQVPWVATKRGRIRADSVFKCTRVQTPYNTDYDFDLPLHHCGYMNSHQKMVFMMAFAHYFFSFTDMTLPYKRFYAR